MLRSWQNRRFGWQACVCYCIWGGGGGCDSQCIWCTLWLSCGWQYIWVDFACCFSLWLTLYMGSFGIIMYKGAVADMVTLWLPLNVGFLGCTSFRSKSMAFLQQKEHAADLQICSVLILPSGKCPLHMHKVHKIHKKSMCTVLSFVADLQSRIHTANLHQIVPRLNTPLWGHQYTQEHHRKFAMHTYKCPSFFWKLGGLQRDCPQSGTFP